MPEMINKPMPNGTQICTAHELRTVKAIHGYGLVVLEYPYAKPDKKMCHGCRDDYYNHAGNSTEGECWAFKRAHVVDKVGHTSSNVAYGPDGYMKETLTCWHSVRH